MWLFVAGLIGISGYFADSPGTPVVKFYTLYLKLRPSGLPTEDEEKSLAPYLSERLLHLIDKARICQNDFIRRNPDEKPSWDDGCYSPVYLKDQGILKL